ncbi:MAG: TIGR02147 family protein [Bdellovibrionota bacterium]
MTADKYTDFREILDAELKVRSKRNPAYSMSAFARDLGLKREMLSDILSGRYGISVKAAQRIAEKMNLSEVTKKVFFNLVALKHARSPRDRNLAAERLEEYYQLPTVQELSEEALSIMSVTNVAILELITINGGLVDSELISTRLSITKDAAEKSLSELLRTKIIAFQQGKYNRVNDFIRGSRAVPTKAIRELHDNILDLSKKALIDKPIPKRKIVSAVISFDINRLEEAKLDIEQFQKTFATKYGNDGGNSVFAFATQFFRLDGE